MFTLKKGNALVKSAFILAVGGFVAKAIGALYRIPLTNLMGGEGMGIYQMVFPMYCMILTLSSTGVPAGLSRLIASKDEREGRRLFGISFVLLLAIGLGGSLLMALLGRFVARAQGTPSAAKSYLALSPSVVIVSLISCYRGYAQGKMKMLPTALSQIIEQASKTALGLLFAYLFMPNIAMAAAGAALGVTLSELIALAYLAIRFRISEPRQGMRLSDFKDGAKQIALAVVPVTVSALLLPLSHVIDSFMVVNFLSRYTPDATALYGLYSGAVTSVVNLPVALAYGVAAAIIPVLSVRAAKGDEGAVNKQTLTAVALTVFIALPSAVYLAVMGKDAVTVLYGGLGEAERETVIALLRVSSISVVFLSLTQTLSAALVGQGKPFVPVYTLAIGVAAKTVFAAVTLQMPSFGIYAAAISTNLCYLVAGTGNLVYSIKGRKTSAVLCLCVGAGFAIGGAAVLAARFVPMGGMPGAIIRTAIAVLVAVALSVCVFVCFKQKFRVKQAEKVDEV